MCCYVVVPVTYVMFNELDSLCGKLHHTAIIRIKTRLCVKLGGLWLKIISTLKMLLSPLSFWFILLKCFSASLALYLYNVLNLLQRVIILLKALLISIQLKVNRTVGYSNTVYLAIPHVEFDTYSYVCLIYYVICVCICIDYLA